MKFYRLLSTIKVISFDLDDTLYDNNPVIQKTILESHAALQAYHPKLSNFTLNEYQILRDELLLHEPEIYHNVSQWRYRAIELALINSGLSYMQAIDGANKIMQVFHYWRNIINIPKETHETLQILSDHLPLIAITNGNVDPQKIGINHYFKFILRAGLHGRAKPWSDMYHLASKNLNVNPIHILHVGDDIMTDVNGSLRAGMQACWMNSNTSNLMKVNDARLLPHLEITELKSLTLLLHLI
ncbi:5-amino-6-(5-phospho-D-ribitylamino)uracil phosphatase YigB [Pantoea sp. Mhis]|uniref:5-amino-6-(5-phospho-D-ribitylamino)uracil phosphatase YigB n=1 Tax=Pantoea sp. Mhis TaxID=2576759 RepID=UPI00135A9006|nr:5-amino-6-(5-phospho-D-ribitylamino)uracil phosphatase YigB [Pantoea sp. Mhis]MXP56420.1 5-amino-6-(5-phospho-D-ribitylamino)uracil phosphatase YigB [Pantoea sp. Mhis]